jgi:hypothetical protein
MQRAATRPRGPPIPSRDKSPVDRSGRASLPKACNAIPAVAKARMKTSSAVPHVRTGRRAKRHLAGGAGEVILVRSDGQLEFWGARDLQQASRLGIALSPERSYCDARDLPSARRVAS